MKTFEYRSGFKPIQKEIENALLFRADRAVVNPGCVVTMEFNGVNLVMTEDSTIDSVYADYCKGIDEQVAEYYNSEEYKIKQRELEIEKSQKAKEMSSLIEEFKGFNLAFNDKAEKIAFLNWIIKYQPYSDYIYSDKKNDAFVVSELKKAGYQKDENVGNKDMTSDEFFRYIIGQAISTMEFLAMHGFVASMATRWLKENN